ncbi:MAG: alpha/beta hydrolase [Chloroflexota bacterium]
MFEGFVTADFRASGATIHYRRGGSGPPLLLLHGNPMTHVSWHKVANELAERFTVVAADLRGYGDSSCPDEPGENWENHSFRAMAQDQIELMEHLGFRQFFAAGHDRGARTIHRMGLDQPERVPRVALLDILPTHHVWTHVSKRWASSSWHWIFMTQPPPFPERMMGSVPAAWFMEHKIGKPGIGLKPFPPEVFAEYVRCFNEKTIRGSCGDYRAAAGIDFQMDSADFDAGRKLGQPALILWGAKSHTGRVYGDVLEVWRRYAADVRGRALDCGHYVPEEAPEEVLADLIEFFGEGAPG